MPEDLAFKKNRLAKIQAAKAWLEARELARHPNQVIEDKKQISFADPDANIMGKRGHVDYACNAQISVDSDKQIIVGQHVSGQANDYGEVVDNSRKACSPGTEKSRFTPDHGSVITDHHE